MRQWKLAAGSRAVAKPRMQTCPKREKPVSFVLLLFALAPQQTDRLRIVEGHDES